MEIAIAILATSAVWFVAGWAAINHAYWQGRVEGESLAYDDMEDELLEEDA